MLNKLKRIKRLIYINWILARYGVDDLVLSTGWFGALHYLRYCNPWNWRPQRKTTRAIRLRLALETLGPIFVKFGQALSTRRDLLPDDIADELAKLQDQVHFFDSRIAINLIEQAFDQPIALIFQQFDQLPLAAASIAQVHTAELHDGRKVIVKILRPDIEKIVRRDIALLYSLAKFTERYWHAGRRLKPLAVVAEFEQTLLDELDLVREAANASQLKRNFAGSDLLHVPDIIWSHTRKNVLVMERIFGTPIANIALLKEQQVDLKKLAENGVEIFFTQVFRDCFFHADMHPGNIFVDIQNPQHPKYMAVDFGIMGTLNPTDQRYLADNLLAFFRRDYRRVANLHVDSGWIPATTRVDQFEAAIRAVCEPIFERPLKDISFGQLLLNLFQTAGRFNMEIQPQLVLLQKTLLNIEGLGRQLYPDLDLWQTAKPYLERWVKQQVGPRNLWRRIQDNLPLWAEKLPEIPDLLYYALKRDNSRPFPVINPEPDTKTTSTTSRKAWWQGFSFGIGLGLLGLGLFFYHFLRG